MSIENAVLLLNNLYSKEEKTVLVMAQDIYFLTNKQDFPNILYWKCLCKEGCKYAFGTLRSRYTVINSFSDLKDIKTLKMSFSNYRLLAENGRSLDKKGKNIKGLIRSEAERKNMSFRDLEKLIKKYLNGEKGDKYIQLPKRLCTCSSCGNVHKKNGK